MRIAVDAMGGDFAPREIVAGTLDAARHLPGIEQLLLVGDEAAGLHWLHRAQDAFEAAAQYDALHQSLANELAYLERTGKKEQAQQARQRLERLLAY